MVCVTGLQMLWLLCADFLFWGKFEEAFSRVKLLSVNLSAMIMLPVQSALHGAVSSTSGQLEEIESSEGMHCGTTLASALLQGTPHPWSHVYSSALLSLAVPYRSFFQNAELVISSKRIAATLAGRQAPDFNPNGFCSWTVGGVVSFVGTVKPWLMQTKCVAFRQCHDS